MKIEIPHLGYTILVKDVSKGKQDWKAWVHRDNNNQCTVFLDLKNLKKPVYFPTIAHEITHVLQFIALARDIDFMTEQEHFGYMTNYILNKILGYSYIV